MQIKTISKVISSKLEEWLESISDSQLKKDLRKNILVSWGCITSMLLNEQVNDYDIYINDMDVLKRLVQYYTKQFIWINILDWRYDRQPRNDSDSSMKIALKTLKEDQIKLYFSWNSWLRVNEDFEWSVDEPKYYPKFFSPNAISLSDDIQIVTRFHWDNVAIHKTFDFIHATNYFTFQEWLVTNKEALESIITKQLKYQWSMYPLTSIIRMKKFIKRNWNISAWEILKIMFQISELDLTNPDVLEEQLIWVDVAYFWVLIEILRWSEDKEITSHYLNTIIDRVFNNDDWDLDSHVHDN